MKTFQITVAVDSAYNAPLNKKEFEEWVKSKLNDSPRLYSTVSGTVVSDIYEVQVTNVRADG